MYIQLNKIDLNNLFKTDLKKNYGIDSEVQLEGDSYLKIINFDDLTPAEFEAEIREFAGKQLRYFLVGKKEDVKNLAVTARNSYQLDVSKKFNANNMPRAQSLATTIVMTALNRIVKLCDEQL
jgi:hypothetical protein